MEYHDRQLKLIRLRARRKTREREANSKVTKGTDGLLRDFGINTETEI